jgi:pimeloyl-ACP methyl ester carboxylesterase
MQIQSQRRFDRPWTSAGDVSGRVVAPTVFVQPPALPRAVNIPRETAARTNAVGWLDAGRTGALAAVAPVAQTPEITRPHHSIRTVAVPTEYGNPLSPEFEFHYERIRGTDPTLPVLLVVPGGPSGGVIGSRLFGDLTEFTQLQADPRGVGRNSNPRLTDASFRCESLARDLLAVVRKEKVDHYIIWGGSFGSILATIIASMAKAEGLPEPKAVLLEGVAGKWQRASDYVARSDQAWERVKAGLSSAARELLEELPKYGLTSEQWAQALAGPFTAGHLEEKGDAVAAFLAPLLRLDEKGRQEYVDQFIRPGVSDRPIPNSRLQDVVYSREFYSDYAERPPKSQRFERGRFIVTFQDAPLKGLHFDHPYDSKNYPVDVPFYYLEGARDAFTPPALARHHVETHTTAQRYYIEVEQGGHQPLMTTLPSRARALLHAVARAEDPARALAGFPGISIEARAPETSSTT